MQLRFGRRVSSYNLSGTMQCLAKLGRSLTKQFSVSGDDGALAETSGSAGGFDHNHPDASLHLYVGSNAMECTSGPALLGKRAGVGKFDRLVSQLWALVPTYGAVCMWKWSLRKRDH